MKVAQKIEQQIRTIPEDTTFGYQALRISKVEYQTAAKALERLLKKGTIKKASKGVFYKPKMTLFGELKPNDQELLRPYLFKNGKRIAYITGYSLYNRLGLTTQMAFRIKIASKSKRIYINRGTIRATPAKSYADVSESNYELLGILDALKDIKKIPDTEATAAAAILIGIIKNLKDAQVKDMIRYALLYPPRVRALLGAMLEKTGKRKGIEKLKNSLNPLSKFKLGIKSTILPTVSTWNIE